MSSFEAAVEYIRKSYRHDRRLDVSLKPVRQTFQCMKAGLTGNHYCENIVSYIFIVSHKIWYAHRYEWTPHNLDLFS